MKPDRRKAEIVSATRITVSPANRQELWLTISSLIDLIRGEEGCRNYRFYGETEDQNAFLLIGEWETLSAWNDHLSSNHFAVLHGSLELLSDQPHVNFQVMRREGGIEAITRARCEPREYKRLQAKETDVPHDELPSTISN
jgi:quinol monooxygenase YgiN